MAHAHTASRRRVGQYGTIKVPTKEMKVKMKRNWK